LIDELHLGLTFCVGTRRGYEFYFLFKVRFSRFDSELFVLCKQMPLHVRGMDAGFFPLPHPLFTDMNSGQKIKSGKLAAHP